MVWRAIFIFCNYIFCSIIICIGQTVDNFSSFLKQLNLIFIWNGSFYIYRSRLSIYFFLLFLKLCLSEIKWKGGLATLIDFYVLKRVRVYTKKLVNVGSFFFHKVDFYSGSVIIFITIYHAFTSTSIKPYRGPVHFYTGSQ